MQSVILKGKGGGWKSIWIGAFICEPAIRTVVFESGLTHRCDAYR